MNSAITDLHIKTAAPQFSLVYPGPSVVSSDDLEHVQILLGKIESIGRDDFMVDHLGTFWRGRRDRFAVDGTWFRLRRIAQTAPNLKTIPSPLPAAIRAILCSNSILRGGLIHICGGPGSGKTTTGAAVISSRLHLFGGSAYTVEDPPEMPLNGFHGSGYCTQTWVAGDDAADWMESMRGALRSQPSGTNLMMYVGEVRDAETARAMLRAASNGFLVISTGFGSDIVSGIDTFFQLVGREYAYTLAGVLRVALYQKIVDGRFSAQALVSEDAASTVSSIIRSGNLAQLQNEVVYQANMLMQGQSLWRSA